MPDAAWLPDPTGRFQYRYWDGSQWSAAVSRQGSQETDVLSTQPPPPVVARRSRRGRRPPPRPRRGPTAPRGRRTAPDPCGRHLRPAPPPAGQRLEHGMRVAVSSSARPCCSSGRASPG